MATTRLIDEFEPDTSLSPRDRYQLIGKIATGGMAEIHLARMRSRSGETPEVILKRLLPRLQADPEFLEMFRDEARVTAQLHHENIARIYDVGALDGSIFIAVELVCGVNLQELAGRLVSSKKKLPIIHLLQIASGVLSALEYSHEAKSPEGAPLDVIHRDVSPSNILVDWRGVVKLVDFGIAKAEGRAHRTRTGVMKGKFRYMAPEQIMGTDIDARADLFALGEVLYELALGRHPFVTETDAATIRATVDVDPPDPLTIDSALPPAFRDLLLRALAKDPADRYPSARAMKRALELQTKALTRGDPVHPLGRFIRESFSDRLLVESRARALHDDQLLVDALRVGGRWAKAPSESGSTIERLLAPRSPDVEATIPLDDSSDTVESLAPDDTTEEEPRPRPRGKT